VGFALETSNEEQNSQKKLLSKNLDFIVLNSLRDSGAGFNHDTNKISIIFKDGKVTHFELKPKAEVANDIAAEIAHFFKPE
jgi:phosphopantothenoylcysteine decarboxylase/phosphopantothenate--cysteine ligase